MGVCSVNAEVAVRSNALHIYACDYLLFTSVILVYDMLLPILCYLLS